MATRKKAIFCCVIDSKKNEADDDWVSLNREVQILKDLFRPYEEQGYLECRFFDSADLRTKGFRLSLEEIGPSIEMFHYLGDEKTFYLLLNEFRLTQIAPNLKLFFHNYLPAEKAAELLIQEGVPAVVACPTIITDTHAEHFAKQFYQALLRPSTIQEAFKFAQESIESMPASATDTR